MKEAELKKILKDFENACPGLRQRKERIRTAMINFNRSAELVVRKAIADIERGFLKNNLIKQNERGRI